MKIQETSRRITRISLVKQIFICLCMKSISIGKKNINLSIRIYIIRICSEYSAKRNKTMLLNAGWMLQRKWTMFKFSAA